MKSTMYFCPYCDRVAASESPICAGCGKPVPPLPHLTPPAKNQPSPLKDGLCCVAAGVGIMGMVITFIAFMAAHGGQSTTDGLVAALAFAGFLTLTVFAWRASEKYANTSGEWTPEDFNRRLSESPELRAALLSVERQTAHPPHETFSADGATKTSSGVSNNGNALHGSPHTNGAKRVLKGTP